MSGRGDDRVKYVPYCKVCGEHHSMGAGCPKKILEDLERRALAAAGPEPARTGCKCPGCGRCWAPHVDRCGECGS